MPLSSTVTNGVDQADASQYNNLRTDALRLLATNSQAVTLSGGAITVSGSYGRYVVDTEGGASADDLDTISGGTAGDMIVLTAANASRVPRIRSGADNIVTADGSHFKLRTTEALVLLYNGTNWLTVPHRARTVSTQIRSAAGQVLTNNTALAQITFDSLDHEHSPLSMYDLANNRLLVQYDGIYAINVWTPNVGNAGIQTVVRVNGSDWQGSRTINGAWGYYHGFYAATYVGKLLATNLLTLFAGSYSTSPTVYFRMSATMIAEVYE